MNPSFGSAAGRNVQLVPVGLFRRSLSLSSRSSFVARLGLALVLSIGASALGCGSSSDSLAAFAESPPVAEDPGFGGGQKTNVTGQDAGAGPTVAYKGNPLCRVESSCMPDDDASRRTAGTTACNFKDADAGATSSSSSSSSSSGSTPSSYEGCRIRKTASLSVAPGCHEAAAEGGGDGAACETGADCAAGFDCVAGEKSKVCRHYCCSSGCKSVLSQNGGPTFCDVQRLADVAHNAPVCMPLKRCKLLAANECAASETCAVVTDVGDTGCVTVGNQQVGQSCDEDHCAAGLTCLGQPGARKCWQLCKVDQPSCTSTQVCTTSTIFKDSKIGICEAL